MEWPTVNPEFYIQQKLSSKNKGEAKTLSDKRKLKELSPTETHQKH